MQHNTNIRLTAILQHVGIMVRKEILGTTERRIVEAYVKGERLKGYTAVLFRIRKIGLTAIIEGCERDLLLLRKLLRAESARESKN
jgi:GTP cyclohydrolase I